MSPRDKRVVGWREWIRLPDLGPALVKAKVDTGARTSALHATDVEIVRTRAGEVVRFTWWPKQRTHRGAARATAPLVGYRAVTSSSGHTERRPVIRTRVDIGGDVWPIELTLTRRDVMGFRMLLGRQALRGHAIVDPARSFVTRKVRATRKARDG
ncbi:MAG: ATP-dependent zinc protease [Deltaproteobacteria bacterium]|nr:MAG: ATP-dependent zinc protease [Deltaproteobacteria bacterium]